MSERSETWTWPSSPTGTYDANIVLNMPNRYKKRQRTFTQAVLTFPNSGVNGKTTLTFTPPRKAQE